MKIVVTCIAWVEALLKKELEKLSYDKIEVVDRMISVDAGENAVAKINLWSRVANKVYIELANKEITDFDALFDTIFSVPWNSYVKNNPISLKVTSIKSELSSVPAIQKIAMKAIFTKLTWSKNKIYTEDNDLDPVEIFLFLKDNELKILLNTSGQALHKRWYRISDHEAPIKESLAASLVLLSNWNFKNNFYDFFCWSWTIAIEAALIARNIAPWLLWRKFLFENFSWYDKKYLEEAKKDAKEKIFSSKYEIIASDISEEYIESAKNNAKNAWVDDTIKFVAQPISSYLWAKTLSWTLVSNPPYWLRMNQRDLEFVYKDIAKIFANNPGLSWWIITSFDDFDQKIDLKMWKKRKLYNGSELCYFYKKIS